MSAIQIKNNWDGLCLDPKKFNEIMHLGKFSNRIPWLTFLATVCSAATLVNISFNNAKAVFFHCLFINMRVFNCWK